jgi:hypothetical protein
MSDPLQHTPREMRFQAYLRRFSRVTRIIGILAVVGSIFTMFAALDMRSESDRIGFSLCAMATLLFGVLVWATGVFHGAVSSALPVLASMDFKLERLARLQAMQATAKTVDAAAPASLPGTAQNPFLTEETAVSERPAPPPPKPPKVEPPPPQKVPCPSCGGLIHPEASRCVHCMKRIKLKQAS